jgi:hypothetical protein
MVDDGPSRDAERNRRSRAKTVAAVVVSIGTLLGSAYLAIDGELLAGLMRALTGPGSGTGAAIPTAGPAIGDVGDVSGGVSQHNSRNTYLYNNEFRVEVVRRTGDAPVANRELRDKVLAVIGDLVATLDREEASPGSLQDLGQTLGSIIEETPISQYQLTSRQFTLAPGTAYFLPGGANSFAYLGPAAEDDPGVIAVMRNGRRVNMRIGSVRVFTQDNQACRLVLHEIAENQNAATFSYTCQATQT